MGGRADGRAEEEIGRVLVGAGGCWWVLVGRGGEEGRQVY
jgi:hypothetical protein